MSKKNVKVKFKFYQVLMEQEGETKPFDLRSWIEQVALLDLKDRVKDRRNIIGRLENINLSEDGKYYKLNFMRMDKVSKSYILTADEAARHVDLEENEYIAQNTVVLYDVEKNIMMIQSNRGSYGVGGIEEYINSFEYFEPCTIDPLQYSEDVNLYERNKITKIDFRFANIKEIEKVNESFEQVLQPAKKAEAVVGHLEFGMGRSKSNEGLNKRYISALIEAMVNPQNRKNISSAKVTLNADRKSIVMDLFENILNVEINFVVQDNGEVSFASMSDKMESVYEESIKTIINKLGIR